MSGDVLLSGFHIMISGIVQGVGFRYYTQRQAKKLGVAGYVRNLPDGRVEVCCEADSEKLDQFINWLSKGPSFARVSKIEKNSQPICGYKDFKIEY